ncbi:Membrane-bound transcription factor site-2 protease-like protein [Nymphaea thermarum]|nr:Membrane-bound transcription factor site-2 protease-like protein [Nymphaea thermarum]
MGPRRRWGRRGQSALIPLQRRTQTLSLSCWYCEYKTFVFNEMLLSLGLKYSRILKVWFSIGLGFSLMAFIVVTMVLVWQSANALFMYIQGMAVWDLTNNHLLRHLILAPSSCTSLIDAGYVIFSTILAVAIHEFGHALAAASEGLRIEYVAIFLATLFPGALVSFDNEVLQSLPRCTNLRIYCAGVWHNAVLSAACWLMLLFLPLLLSPLYIHGSNPMVLSVSPTSPLSKKLGYGDVIVSMDGSNINDPEEWRTKLASIESKAVENIVYSGKTHNFFSSGNGKGYCVPVSWLEEKRNLQALPDTSGCPDGLKAFVVEPCPNSTFLHKLDALNSTGQRIDDMYCLVAKDIVGLQKCGDRWPASETGNNSCSCPEGESCLSRMKVPGSTWLEVGYSTPYEFGCFYGEQRSCGGSFVIEDNALSIAKSVQLTAYRPRWFFFSNGYFPAALENLLAFTLHISAGLVLLNVLPVVRLDGDCIMEVAVSSFTWWSPRRRSKLLKVCLFGGTVLSIFAFLRIFIYNLSLQQNFVR